MSCAVLRILLVEDHPADAELLQHSLATAVERFDVTHVETMADAVDQLRSTAFDAALVDLSLPDSHGIGTLEQLVDAAPHVPMVVLTGINDEALALEAIRQGAQDYLVKGTDNGSLVIRAIRYARERKRAEEALRDREEVYGAIVSQSEAGILLLDPETLRFVEFNGAACSGLGYTRKEFAALRLTDIQTVVSPRELSERIQRLLKTGGGTFANRHRCNNGEIRDRRISVRVTNIRGRDLMAVVWIDITEHKAREREIERLNRLYSALGELDQTVAHVQSRDELFREVCRIATEKAGFKLAWVGWTDPETHAVIPIARAGDDTHYVDKITLYADDRPEGRGPTGTCIRENKLCVFNDFANDTRTCPWHAAIIACGLRAVAALPIRFHNEVCGALTVYDREPNVFQDKEVALLEEAAAAISFALEGLDRKAERQRADQALRESEQRYRSLFQNMLEGFAYCQMLYDEHGRPVDFVYLAVNKAFERLTGLKDVVGKRVTEVIPGIREASPELFEAYGRVAFSGKPEEFEFDFKSMRLWLCISVYSPRRGYFVAVFDNITERKRAEEQLRTSHERLKLAQQAANAGLWDWDVLTGKLTWSEELYKLFGMPPAAEASFDAWLAVVHPDDRQPAMARIRRDNEKRQPHQSEYRVLLPDGKERWLEALGNTTYDDAGQPIRMAGICVDITARKQAEGALRESEERFRAFMNNTPTIAWAKDEQGRFVYLNSSYERQLGVRLEDWRGKTDFDLWPPDIAQKYVENDAAVLKGGKVVEVIEETRDYDGRCRYWWTFKFPFHDASGKRLVGGVGIDVTEQQRYQEERETTIEFLRLVSQSTGTRDLVRAATTFFQQQSGCQAVGVRLKEGDDYPYFEARGFPAEFVLVENSLCARDRAGAVQRDSAGYPILECMCGNVICGRFDASQPFFTAQGSFWTNCTTELLATSSEAGRLARTRNRCNAAGYESVALIPLHVGEDRLGLLQLNDRRKGRFSPATIALWERLAGHLAVALAKFRSEERLKRAKLAAEAASRVKSEFLANMSHEIRTPMTAILGFSDLLTTPDLPLEEQREFLAGIQRNGKALLELIGDILDLSRIEAQKLTLAKTDCSLQQIIDDALSVVQVRAREQQLSLEVDYQYPLPETIHTDPARLRQILVNLAGNAVKFTAQGGVRITVRSAGDDGRPARLQFAVSDTGIGIAADKIGGLFQPFMQADTSASRRYGGAGLGLAISQRLANALGGQIEVVSAVGKGSTFTLTIETGSLAGVPLLRAPQPALSPRDDRAAGGENAALQGRLLLAEDDPDLQRLVRLILRKMNLEIDVAGNGQIACDMAEKSSAQGRPYDLILMDIQMPDMNGYEATRRLRERGWRGPIVALTAHAMTGDREKCLAAGCDDYVAKPVMVTGLREALARHLARPVDQVTS